jgi:hypothetical protein
MKDKIKSSAKAHTVYKTADGTRVPGVTTIVGLLAKPALVGWANRLGLEGVDCTKYKDEAADIGTLAHAMVQAHLQGTELDKADYSPKQVDLAENCFLSFLEWEKQHKIAVINCEKPYTSDGMRYGGTIDCLCELDGELTLLDFKSGTAIYPEYLVQLAAYAELLKEYGCEVQKCRILRIGRDETEGFEERVITDWRKYFEVFESLLNIYNLKRELKWA